MTSLSSPNSSSSSSSTSPSGGVPVSSIGFDNAMLSTHILCIYVHKRVAKEDVSRVPITRSRTLEHPASINDDDTTADVGKKKAKCSRGGRKGKRERASSLVRSPSQCTRSTKKSRKEEEGEEEEEEGMITRDHQRKAERKQPRDQELKEVEVKGKEKEKTSTKKKTSERKERKYDDDESQRGDQIKSVESDLDSDLGTTQPKINLHIDQCVCVILSLRLVLLLVLYRKIHVNIVVLAASPVFFK